MSWSTAQLSPKRKLFSGLSCGLVKGYKSTCHLSDSQENFVPEWHVLHGNRLTIHKLKSSGKTLKTKWKLCLCMWLSALWLAHRVWGRGLSTGEWCSWWRHLWPCVFVSSGVGWRGAAHSGGDGRAAAAEHGVRIPVSPGGGQKVRVTDWDSSIKL